MARGSKFALVAGVVTLLTLMLVGALAAFAPDGQLRTSEQDDVAYEQNAGERQSLGLMTSLPIYWRSTGNMADLLAPASGDEQQHWVREYFEADYNLLPLDSLSDENGGVASELAGLDVLLLAQPYTLTPADNVALDEWVRGGGRLLMFADPVLTEHSEFALGDRRRPQEVGLVPPVFARWGLVQSFDPAQPQGGSTVQWEGQPVPVNQRGRFAAVVDQSPGHGSCAILADGLLARCLVGEGTIMIMADAALLEDHSSDAHLGTLDRLVGEALVGPVS